MANLSGRTGESITSFAYVTPVVSNVPVNGHNSDLMVERQSKYEVQYDTQMYERTPFIVALMPEFTSYKQLLGYVLTNETNSESAEYRSEGMERFRREANSDMDDVAQSITDQTYIRMNCKDTSLGGNPAINCYPQFNEDDDIVHLMNASRVANETVAGKEIIIDGLGRVYHETYDTHQKILWISAGVAKFSGVMSFYKDAVDKDMANLLNGSSSIFSMENIGNFLVKSLLLPIDIVATVARYLNDVVQILRRDSISKYYDFWSDMLLYYKYVNTILQHLTVNLGLFPKASTQDEAKTVTGSGSSTASTLVDSATNESDTQANIALSEYPSIPEFLDEGVDIFKIVNRRETFVNTQIERDAVRKIVEKYKDKGVDYFFKLHRGEGKDVNKLLDEKQDDEKSMFSTMGAFIGEFGNSFFGMSSGADKYLGFRVEKSTDTSDSFSNSTGESSVAQMVNGAASSAREFMFTTQMNKDKDSGIVGGLVDGVVNGIAGMGKAVIDTLGLSTALQTIVTGNAYVDIPEVWTGSQYSKSYSFRMTFRDFHGGNPISWLTNIGVPLACMLPLALPRSAGKNSYGSPFLIRAYCDGMFAIPLGLVGNMTVSRGGPEHGWSTFGLPTVLDISFDIKDLATVMHMSLCSVDWNPASILTSSFSANTPFQEYLLTLSNVGIRDRTSILRKMRRNKELWIKMRSSTILNPSFLGMWAGSSFVGGVMHLCSRFNGLPN